MTVGPKSFRLSLSVFLEHPKSILMASQITQMKISPVNLPSRENSWLVYAAPIYHTHPHNDMKVQGIKGRVQTNFSTAKWIDFDSGENVVKFYSYRSQFDEMSYEIGTTKE